MSQHDIFILCYVVFAIGCTAAELWRPARKLDYRRAVPPDVVAFLLYQFVIFPLAVQVSDPVYKYVHLPPVLLAQSLPMKILLFYLAADLGSYFMHRLMHTRYVWRVHRFHHSPTAIYWLAGVRATIPQQILFNLPFIVALPILRGAPRWVFIANMVEGVFRNNWMHMNVTWRSNLLEWVFVTPRYHHIHHSTDEDLHHGNFGSLFSIWDRLFHTYVNPDGARPEKFGTGEEDNPLRLVIGV